MKIHIWALIFLAGTGLHIAKGQDMTRPINTNWTFNYYPSETADKGYEDVGFDDSRWLAVSIPHTWHTFEFTRVLPGGYSDNDDPGNTYWRNGWGWYRKSFTISREYAGKKVFIEFDGVQDRCKIWFNGVYIGDHSGSTRPFGFDLTPHIRPGSVNVIAVAVHNSSVVKESGPSFCGGIFRNVRIVLKNKLYVPFRDSSGSPGMLVSTPGFSGKACPVRIQTTVTNDNPQSRHCTIQSTVYDPRGKVVQQVKSSQEISPGRSFTFDLATKPVSNPQLWSPDNPNLYKVVTEVFDGKVVTESISCFTGFRWFKQEGPTFYLNGKPFTLHGDKYEGIMQGIGNAIPENITEDEFREAKDNKLNFRLSAVPAGEYVYNLADRLGMIIFETEEVSENNHPSVFSAAAENILKIPGVFQSVGGQLPSGEISTEPARINLSSRQKNIPARPGSLAIINCSVTDSDGNPVESKIALHWTVDGPARLISASSDVNIIRCTGEPGKIRVMAYSPSLASGEIEISSVPTTETLSAITESPLNLQGRPGHVTIIKPARVEPVPYEVRPFSEDLSFSMADEAGHRKTIRELLLKNNPSVDTSTAEFRALTRVLGAHLYKNKGHLSAADINYNIDHFNNCRLIAGYVQATKLPQPFKEGLRTYYAHSVIARGEEKNAGDEMNWLNWIPSGGIVVYIDTNPDPAAKGTITTTMANLPDIIALVYPQFKGMSEDAKARAIDFIARMNPWVHPNRETTTGFIAERGKPVLIPLFKFIAE